MIFASDYNEDSFYSYSIFDGKYTLDAYGCKKADNCYEIIDCHSVTKTFFSQSIENSKNIYFSFNLKNCTNCLLCDGLQNKEYYYKNENIWKDRRENEIEPLIKDIFVNNKIEEYKKEFDEMVK